MVGLLIDVGAAAAADYDDDGELEAVVAAAIAIAGVGNVVGGVDVVVASLRGTRRDWNGCESRATDGEVVACLRRPA